MSKRKRWCNRTKKWSNDEAAVSEPDGGGGMEWRLGFEKKMQSIIKPTPTDLGPVQRPRLWRRRGGLALAPRALTTAGQQAAGVDGGVGAALLARAWEATIKAGQTNRWNGRRGSAHRV